MGRKLYYIDSYGHVQRDRKAEKKSQKSDGFSWTKAVMWTLAAFAVLMVLASLIH